MKLAQTLAACAVLLLLIGVTAVNSKNIKRSDYEPVIVTVHTGDTAWSIARRYCPENVDIREYLDLCAAENGVTQWGMIYPGDTYTFLTPKK